MADPEKLDERDRAEERHRPHHLDGGEDEERPPAVPPRPHRPVRGGRGGAVPEQDEGHQDGGRDEERRRAHSHRDEERGRQHRSQEEADTAAGGEDAHRGRAVPGSLPGRLAGGRVEHRHAQAGQQDQQPDRRVGPDQTGQAQADPGDGQSGGGEPAEPVAVHGDADEGLGDRTAQGRREGESRGGDIAVAAVQHEVRDAGGDEALVQVVHGVRGAPHPHPAPGGCGRSGGGG